MNSREKGKRGERLWRDQLREAGFNARRGQQYAGGPDSPDVICDELNGLHQEVKFGNSIQLPAAIRQAKEDAGGKPWIVAHKRNNQPWIVSMDASLFFGLLRDGIEHFAAQNRHGVGDAAQTKGVGNAIPNEHPDALCGPVGRQG
jgi:Holliday junction resolvase